MLKNPAYKGTAAFGRTRNGPLRPRLRAQRGHSLQPRRGYSIYDVPCQEWITIPVPGIVDPDLWDVVQDQLRDNQHLARTGKRGATYLLQGWISCNQCGYAFCGKATGIKARTGAGNPTYYRCVGTDAYRFGGQKICNNGAVRTDKLDLAVWHKVRALLETPDFVANEYKRRLSQSINTDELSAINSQIGKLRRGIDRLIDTYAAELIGKSEFEPRISRFRERIAQLEQQAQQASSEAAFHNQFRLIVGRLEDFTSKIKGNLDTTDWTTKRDIIRALVKTVDIGRDAITVVFKVNPPPFESRPERGFLQYCWWRNSATLGNGRDWRQPQRGCALDSCGAIKRESYGDLWTNTILNGTNVASDNERER